MSSLVVDKGIVKLYDGTVVYIVEIQYSADGSTFWESTYNSASHVYEGDGITTIPGHKYMRIRHAEDTDFQMPMYITATDGDSPEFRVYSNYIQWKLTLEDVWINLVDLDDLKGVQGEEGIAGAGLQIDAAGALDTRPACCASSTVSTGCGCSSSTTSALGGTFLSLGNHLLITSDIGSYYTVATNDTGWTLVTQALIDLGTYAVGWGAVDGTDSTAAAYTLNDQGQTINYDANTPIDTNGRVYACAGGVWSLQLDLAANTGQIKTSTGDTLNYLDQKVDGTTLEAYDSGVGYNDNIRVADDGIDENKIISTATGDGLTGGSGTVITVVGGDLVGTESHGLETFTHTDTTTDIRIDVSDLEGDGIDLEGASPTQTLQVDVVDLVDATLDGLTTYTAADTFDNLRVLAGDGIALNSDGVNVIGDELSITAAALSAIKVMPNDNATLGITNLHTNPLIADETQGIRKDAAVTGKLEVKVDASTIGFDGTGNLEVPDNGITGDKIADAACDNTKGVEILSDKIAAKVDGSSIGFNGSGELELQSITGASISANQVVKSIDDGSNVAQDAVTFVAAGTAGVDLTVTVNPATDDLTIAANANLAYLNANLSIPAGAVAWGSITGTLSAQTDVVAYIDAGDADKLVVDTWYDNARIVDTIDGTYASKGLWLKSSGGTIYKLRVDDSGALFTTTS